MPNSFSIGGVAYDGPNTFVWPFVTGPFSPEARFTVSNAATELLEFVQNPVSIDYSVNYRINSEDKTDQGSIKGLYLRPAVPSGDHKFEWKLSDIRWVVENKQVGRLFGLTRQANEFIKLTPDARGDFNRAPKRHFIPHTLRKRGFLQFANTLTPDEDLVHWTAFQALRYMLTTWFEQARIVAPNGSKLRPKLVVLDATDNKRPLVNFSTNQTWPRVIRRLLSLSHTGLYVNERAEFVLYDLAPIDLPQHVGGFTGGGHATATDMRRDRPRGVRALFRQELEMRANYFEKFLFDDNATGTVTARSQALKELNRLTMTNVMILPQDVRSPSEGRIYQRGEIVTIKKGLELWKNDPDNPIPPLSNGGNAAISIEEVRKHSLTGALATLWTLSLDRVHRRDNLWASRVKTVMQAYRRLFRLDPRLLDMIETIRAETGSIVDNVTGKRAPAAAWMSHFVIPSSRVKTPKGFKTPRNLSAAFNVHPWGVALKDETDPNLLPIETTEVSPLSLRFIDKRQGLFTVDFLPDLYGDVYRYIRAVFPESQKTFFKRGYLLGVNTRYLTQFEMTQTFQLSVLFSVTMRVPNSVERLEIVTASSADIPPNSEGPEVDIMFGGMHAFRTYRDGISKIAEDVDTGSLFIRGNRLANKSIIDDLAKSVFQDVYFRFQDLVIGVFRAVGHDPEVDKPRGNYATGVEYNGAAGSLKTVYDASTDPTPPPIWELLPPDTQRVLYRLEDNPNP